MGNIKTDEEFIYDKIISIVQEEIVEIGAMQKRDWTIINRLLTLTKVFQYVKRDMRDDLKAGLTVDDK